MAEEIERIFVIPLKKPGFKSSVAAPTAVKRVKGYLTRHMKVEEDKIWIDDSLNDALWARGKFKIPSKIRVKAVKFDDGVVEAYLPELEFKKSRRELIKEEREKKTPILRREEAPEEEGEGGAEDYEVAPTADGEVKIKKKKAAKQKKKETEEKTEKEEKKETKKQSKEKAKPKKEPKKEEKPKKTAKAKKTTSTKKKNASKKSSSKKPSSKKSSSKKSEKK
jgi:large subunit ribosomal protein L31e